MSVNSSGRRKLKKTIYAASTLMLAAAVILAWGPGKGSQAAEALEAIHATCRTGK